MEQRVNARALLKALGIAAALALTFDCGMAGEHGVSTSGSGLFAAGAGDSEAVAVTAGYGKVPLAFERNQGQVNERVKFLARTQSYQVFLAGTEAVFELKNRGDATRRRDARSVALRMAFVGANQAPKMSGIELLERKSNYLIGNDPRMFVTDVPNYAKVQQHALYRGIDMVFYGNEQQLEYDFLVAPRANPKQIRFKLSGAQSMKMSDAGDLVLRTPAGNLTLRKPDAYQEIAGQRVAVAARYVLAQNRQVGFELGNYDDSRPLVIDPILSYSTYLSGTSADYATGIALDAGRNAYIVGHTSSTDFPVKGAYQKSRAGYQDVFVTKLNSTGTGILYSTYLGARRGSSYGYAIAVDGAGNAYITGTTDSASFPVTAGAYQTTNTGVASFVAKLNSSGNALAYSTYINTASSSALAIDFSGNAYVAGKATSGFSITPNAFQTNNRSTVSPYQNGFVLKLNAAGSAAIYATYLGGSANDSVNGIAVDSSGNAFVTGTAKSADFPTTNPYQAASMGQAEAFASKLNDTGTQLFYSTYLGGSADDYGRAIAVDGAGNAYVVGTTFSNDFPVWNAFQSSRGHSDTAYSSAFVAKLGSSGNTMAYSSYLGGSPCASGPSGTSCWLTGGEEGLAVAVDQLGYAYLAGVSQSTGFPYLDSLERAVENTGYRRPFVAKIKPDGTRRAYAAVFGVHTHSPAAATGVATDGSGNAYVTGYLSYSLPVTVGAFQPAGVNTVYDVDDNAFVLKLGPGAETIRVDTSPNPAYEGQQVTLTAEVEASNQGGLVMFYMNDSVSLGTAALSSGMASLSTSLPIGVQKISAVYSADGKASRPVFQIVNLPATCP